MTYSLTMYETVSQSAPRWTTYGQRCGAWEPVIHALRPASADDAEKNAAARELHAPKKGSFWVRAAGREGHSPVSGVGAGGHSRWSVDTSTLHSIVIWDLWIWENNINYTPSIFEDGCRFTVRWQRQLDLLRQRLKLRDSHNNVLWDQAYCNTATEEENIVRWYISHSIPWYAIVHKGRCGAHRVALCFVL